MSEQVRATAALPASRPPGPVLPLRKGRGRRPAAAVRSAALQAAGDLLFEGGVSEVTFEKVAIRAGISKQTLYKWWPSRGALAFQAYTVAVETRLAFEDTGDIAADLTQQLRHLIHLLIDEGGGPVIVGLISLAQTDPDLAQAFSEHYMQPRRRLAVDRLHKAQESGQLRSDIDCEVVVDQLWGACYHRLMKPAQPLTPEFADQLVDNILRGIKTTKRL